MFEDLGFSPERAENLRVRSELAVVIRRELHARKLNQTEAAALFGVTQPRISDLVRGKIHLFSIDALVSMLAHAQIPISIGTEHKIGVPGGAACVTVAPPPLRARAAASLLGWSQIFANVAPGTVSASSSVAATDTVLVLAA